MEDQQEFQLERLMKHSGDLVPLDPQIILAKNRTSTN